MTNPLTDVVPKRLKLKDPPLERMLAAIAFTPVLRITDEEDSGIAHFQELVRGIYPEITLAHQNELSLETNGEDAVVPSLTKKSIWHLHDANYQWRVTLSSQSISIETQRKDQSRDEFVARLLFLMDSVHKVYAPNNITKIGFRFLNVFGKEKMKKFNDYVRPQFYCFDEGELSQNLRHSSNMAEFSVPEGTLISKHGTLAEGMMHEFMLRPVDEKKWFLDIDVFDQISQKWDQDKIKMKSDQLTGRICTFFSWVMTEKFWDSYSE